MTRPDRRAAAAAAGATLLGSAALLPVFTTTAWLRPVLSVVLAVWGGGLLLRHLGPAIWQRLLPGRPVPGVLAAVGVLLVPLVQLALVLCVLTVFYAPDDAWWRIGPTPTSVADLAAVLVDGTAELQEQATPALPLTGLVALTTVLVGLVAVAVDLVAVAGRQAALAGLGLLGLYCVPVSTVTGSVGLAAIVAPASGFALLLWADQRRRLAAGDRVTARAVSGNGSRAALRVGAFALLSGVLIGAVVPTLPEGSFGTGLGGGAGPGTVGTALDPVAALRGQLTLPEPVDLLRVETGDADPGHLRAVVLDEYNPEAGWVMSNLDGEQSVAQEGLAPVPGGQATREISATISALEHDDRFLPVLWSPQVVTLPDRENWRFDPRSGTVFGRDTTTQGRTWFVQAERPTPSAALLESAPPLDPGDPVQQRFTELPELDPSVPALVARLVEGAETPYARARAISDYLSDRDNGFIYSLSTAEGTSDDDLVNFLDNKSGYCEQYAGAMTVLVRAAQVPARMVLGYTPGEVQDDGSRLVTTDDAHAWVEVYFDGLGWVPFDPTPISQDRSVDLPWAPRGNDPAADPTAGGTATSAPQAAPAPQTDRGATQIPEFQQATATTGWLQPLLVGVGAVLLAATLVAVPATARVLRRRRRVATGAPTDVWDELAATVHDLGLPWDRAWTPRQTAVHLGEQVGHGSDPLVAEHAENAVRQLALAEEAASYGRVADVDAERAERLHEALGVARRGLMASVPRWTRVRATLWPASLVVEVAAGLAARARRIGELVRSRRSRPA